MRPCIVTLLLLNGLQYCLAGSHDRLQHDRGSGRGLNTLERAYKHVRVGVQILEEQAGCCVLLGIECQDRLGELVEQRNDEQGRELGFLESERVRMIGLLDFWTSARIVGMRIENDLHSSDLARAQVIAKSVSLTVPLPSWLAILIAPVCEFGVSPSDHTSRRSCRVATKCARSCRAC